MDTAHAMRTTMAAGAPSPQQCAATTAAVTQRLGRQDSRLASQRQATGTLCPWLQRDIHDAVQHGHAEGYRDGIIVSIGFLCDHVELLDDLDIQARDMAMACGMTAQRAATVGTRRGLLSRLRT
jgi:protoporphyrin/coproporphyrin ferrochelatase